MFYLPLVHHYKTILSTGWCLYQENLAKFSPGIERIYSIVGIKIAIGIRKKKKNIKELSYLRRESLRSPLSRTSLKLFFKINVSNEHYRCTCKRSLKEFFRVVFFLENPKTDSMKWHGLLILTKTSLWYIY